MQPSAMNERKALALLSTYGADAKRWPKEHKAALADAAKRYPRVASTLTREAQLDEALNGYAVISQFSLDAVLARVERVSASSLQTETVNATLLPTDDSLVSVSTSELGTLERLLDNLLAATPFALTRLGLAAMVPLAVGVWLGSLAMPAEEPWWEVEQTLFAPIAEEISHG